MTRTYDSAGFRETAAATELRTADGRCFQALGEGEGVRAMLTRATEKPRD